MAKEILCAYGVDVDAVAGWLGSYGGEDSPGDIPRHKDCEPYYVRVGDSWRTIDYTKQPDEWMKPLERGEETDLIEIPASWYLDDLPPMMFIKKAPNSHGFVNPRHLEEMWMDA